MGDGTKTLDAITDDAIAKLAERMKSESVGMKASGKTMPLDSFAEQMRDDISSPVLAYFQEMFAHHEHLIGLFNDRITALEDEVDRLKRELET